MSVRCGYLYTIILKQAFLTTAITGLIRTAKNPKIEYRNSCFEFIFIESLLLTPGNWYNISLELTPGQKMNYEYFMQRALERSDSTLRHSIFDILRFCGSLLP